MADTNYNKLVAQILGIVLVLVGILGFIIQPTLIVFGVNALHNVVHLVTGAVLLIGAYMAGGRNARMINMVLGFVYILVALLGFVAPSLTDSLVNSGADSFSYADAILHAILGIVLVGVAFTMKQDTMMGKPAM